MQCNRTESLNALHYQVLHEPKKLAVIGSGCSVATEPAAEVSHYFNITQVSCAKNNASIEAVVRSRHDQWTFFIKVS